MVKKQVREVLGPGGRNGLGTDEGTWGMHLWSALVSLEECVLL